MRKISLREAALDAILIFLGSLLFAFGLDCFEVPNGLAAGGITGLATVFHALALQVGVSLPVGIQSIAMNVLLFAYVVRSGSKRYAILTAAGIIVSGILTDALAPFVPVLGEGDLLLCALWGGVITGIGLGMVFRTGGNTGGTDIIAQLIARKTGASVGSMAILVDGAIVAISAPVFSIENALYAAVAMYICGRVIDTVVDGPRVQRAAYIISEKHERIAQQIMDELDRGCTEFEARGMWSRELRPVIFCVLSRGELAHLKEIVAETDPDAIVVIAEVHEAYGEGFKSIDGR
ncbi:YitT family protein [Olsenella sp. Marseille-P4559]|uniref:YitT family protein n=1 Tax=Olsenella sp. Marseille-P4559 TaxID=2364795 RepID=UPI001F5F0152|nr:YitT family protein [Olsenella sp. Marseille-P4559]